MKFFRQIYWLAALRFLILIRQKLGWMSLLSGILLIPLALVVARVSFVAPDKIFWDFSLGFSFLLQVLLASYLGSHVLEEERSRKTLHVLCSGRVSRGQWVWGQVLGIWSLLSAMNFAWYFLTAVISKLVFGYFSFWIHFQAQIFVSIEVAIVTAMALLLSMYLRSALTWLCMLSLLALLHSVSFLVAIMQERMFEVSGASEIYDYLFKALYFLPPLEWLDLRVFVGYESYFSWASFSHIGLLGIVWALFLTLISQRQVERLDF